MFTGLASPSHLIIVLVIILLLFGAKRIPELAKGLGTGIKEFRAATTPKRSCPKVRRPPAKPVPKARLGTIRSARA